MTRPYTIAPDKVLTIWVIYKHPKDFPTSWVLRGQDACADVVKPHAASHVASTLEGARRGLPPGLYNLGRNDDDDAAIYECWI